MITPLFIVLYAGELVWREREAGLGEITGAAPVPNWVRFLGKFLGLSLILAVWMALLMAAGMAVQVRMGYYKFEIGLYLESSSGLQLPEYLLFAVLALVVQGTVNQKYLGHLLALLAYVVIAFAPWLGIDHDLLVYGSSPVDVLGHARLRRVAGAVDLVHALLGRVGAAAGGGGHGALDAGAREGARACGFDWRTFASRVRHWPPRRRRGSCSRWAASSSTTRTC